MTTMGMKKDPRKPRRTLKRTAFKCKNGGLKRGKPLRKVSKKQAKRNRALKGKLEVLLHLQMELFGTNGCQIGKCCRPGDPLVVEHVETRNETNPDRWTNLGIACWSCNSWKGSKRIGEYRPESFIQRLKELEAEEQ